MSLSVHVFLVDQDGGQTVLDTPPGCSDLAGFESWRTDVWGSDVVRSLGVDRHFLPTLATGDLYVMPAEVSEFLHECMLLRANLGRFGAPPNPRNSLYSLYPPEQHGDRVVTEYRNGISERLANVQVAGGRALGHGGGVLIW